MNRPTSFAALAAAVFLLAGCHRDVGIVGRWRGATTLPGTPLAPQGVSLPTTAEFTSGGAVTWTIGDPGRMLTTHGAYTLHGTTLTVLDGDVDLNGQLFPSPPGGPPVSEVYTVRVSDQGLTLDRQGLGTRITLTRPP